jgi:hypothetical protein
MVKKLTNHSTVPWNSVDRLQIMNGDYEEFFLTTVDYLYFSRYTSVFKMTPTEKFIH